MNLHFAFLVVNLTYLIYEQFFLNKHYTIFCVLEIAVYLQYTFYFSNY